MLDASVRDVPPVPAGLLQGDSERDRLRSAIDGMLDDVDLHACELRRRYGRSYAAASS